MNCPKCQFENPEGKKFCGRCGTKMESICPSCQSANPPDFQFCGDCSHRLEAEHSFKAQPLPPPDSARKHVTVLFSDMSGYTAMTEKLDPEETKEIMGKIFGEISKVVAKYGGFIEKFMGDAVMALFGVPTSHEDDPVRAIKASREIHDVVSSLSSHYEKRIGKPQGFQDWLNPERINMDFKTLLTDRRSIRDFQKKEVPLSLIKEILQDTCLPPTARNSQPCRFIIIQDRDVIKRMSDENKKNLLFDISQDPASPMKQLESRFRDDKFNVFYKAPCLVLFIGPVGTAFLDVDCALTAAYFMFSATSRGLGTCWIGSGMHIRSHKMLRDLGIPEDCRIVAPIIVGYPTVIPPAPERHAPTIIKIL